MAAFAGGFEGLQASAAIFKGFYFAGRGALDFAI